MIGLLTVVFTLALMVELGIWGLAIGLFIGISGMVVSRRPVPGISHVHGGAVPLVAQAGGTAPSPYENEY